MATTRWQAGAGIVLAIVLVCVVCMGVPANRRSILRSAGWVLVVNERVEPADIIVVAVDADGAGVLEAADLVHRGVATRVAVFAVDPNTTVKREFIRRGIPYEDAASRSVRQLGALGVDTVDRIPKYVAGTEEEGPALADWCNQHGFHSVVVVSTSDHSRRLQRVLRRSMKGRKTRVTICPTHYSEFDPDRWWETRSGIRTQVEEFEKLLLDVVRHPIS
jgi:hypothetical protein